MIVNNMHFMREVLVTDYSGRVVPTMQSSNSNADCLNPTFKEVAFYDHAAVSALYRELGGGRSEGALIGSTVIIPNRSGWARRGRISAAEVKVVSNVDFQDRSAESDKVRKDQARERDRLMRD